MDFNLTENQQTIRDTILKVAGEFDDSYWLEKDKAGGFPEDFYSKFAEDGWLGIAMPEKYGGAGLYNRGFFNDAGGSRIRSWNERGLCFTYEYFWTETC